MHCGCKCRQHTGEVIYHYIPTWNKSRYRINIQVRRYIRDAWAQPVEDELQGRPLVLLARTVCLSSGDGDRQIWAVERSALQVGHSISISMNYFLTLRHHAESMFLTQPYVDVAFHCHPHPHAYRRFYDTGPVGRSDVQRGHWGHLCLYWRRIRSALIIYGVFTEVAFNTGTGADLLDIVVWRHSSGVVPWSSLLNYLPAVLPIITRNLGFKLLILK